MKQMIEMQKAAFGTMMNNTSTILDQSDLMLNSALSLATWMPEEMKSVFRQQRENQRKAVEYFKKSAEDGFENLMKFVDDCKFPKCGF